MLTYINIDIDLHDLYGDRQNHHIVAFEIIVF